MSKVNRKVLSAKICYFGIVLLVLLCGQVHGLEKPKGPVILTVSGLIGITNASDRAEFDYDMLVELGLIQKKINTVWTPLNSIFKGILTNKLMEAVDAQGSRVRAVAINDYAVNIPLRDLTKYSTILATHRNGTRLTPRDQGPLWILYDNTDRPGGTQGEINAKMIWQLSTLIVE